MSRDSYITQNKEKDARKDNSKEGCQHQKIKVKVLEPLNNAHNRTIATIVNQSLMLILLL